MKKLFLVSALVLVFSGFLCHEAFVFSAWAAAPPPTTIRFKGGSCEIYAILEGAPIAPTGMKENEAALALRFKYVLNKGVATDALGDELYEKGRLKAPDGKTYKAGAALIMEDESIYSLIFAVPKDLDVWALKFTLGKSTTQSLEVEGDRIVAK